MNKFPIIIKSLNSFLIYSLDFFWAPYLLGIGLNGYQIGLIMSSYSIAGLINTLPSGFLSDKLNSKKLVQIAILLLCLSVLGAGVSQNFYIILISFIIGGMGNNLFKISIDSFYLKTKETQSNTKNIGYYLASNQIAYGSGLILSGFLQSVLPLKIIAISISILLLINYTFAYFLNSQEKFSFKAIEYKKDLFKKEILIFLCIFFLFSLHYGSENTSYGLFLKENLHLTTTQMGLYIGICIILMAFPAIIISRKFESGSKTTNIIYLGLLISGCGYLLSAYPEVITSFTGRVIHEFGDAVMFIVLYRGFSKLFPSERLGGNMGIIIVVTIIGSSIGSLIFAPIGTKLGYEWPIFISSTTTLLCIPFTYYFKNLIKH